MPILDDNDRAALAAELTDAAYAGLDDAAAADALNAPGPAVPNPDPAPLVPRVMAETELGALLTEQSQHALLTFVNFGLVKRDIEAQNHFGVAAWAARLGPAPGLGLIGTADEVQAVQGYALVPVPDPAHPATVPGPSRKTALFGERVWDLPGGGQAAAITPAMVAEARGSQP